jgi:transposase
MARPCHGQPPPPVLQAGQGCLAALSVRPAGRGRAGCFGVAFGRSAQAGAGSFPIRRRAVLIRHGVHALRSKSRIKMQCGTGASEAGERYQLEESLERENRELRQANEILRKVSAYFAQAELDRRFEP